MKKENLIKLINQIKKYNLVEAFKNPEEFDEWLSSLDNKQIENFNSLTIEPSLIPFPKYLLINKNLLECNDYLKRIDAMLKLNNLSNCNFITDRLCSKSFLESRNYYNDIELISKALPEIARYILLVIADDEFINSKYHQEDLNAIINVDNKTKEKKFSYSIIAEALAEVAKNKNSINGPYHQEDMKLISTCDSEVLQNIDSYPYDSVNVLAIDSVSLKDRYHLENMQILAKNPIARKYLYKLMTNEEIINGKYYREEINALINAKSKITAKAIYNYITNPKRIYNHALAEDWLDDKYTWIYRNENVKGNESPNYLDNLKLLNEIDDKIVLYFETLLSNKNLIESLYYEYDLNLILQITDEEIFMDVYRTILDETFMFSLHHINDLEIISKTKDKNIRNWLASLATDEFSINSSNHQYDMQYISKLNFDTIPKERLDLIYHYLFIKNGINNPNHIEILEDIYKGEPIKKYNIVSIYLDELQEKLNNSNTEINLINNNNSQNKVLSKIKKLFKN